MGKKLGTKGQHKDMKRWALQKYQMKENNQEDVQEMEQTIDSKILKAYKMITKWIYKELMMKQFKGSNWSKLSINVK